MRLLPALLLMLMGKMAGAASVLIATESFPPYQIVRERVVTGYVADKVTAMFRQAGVSYRMRAYPWQRAYNTVLATPSSCLFSTTRTPAREAHFTWLGPLSQSEWTMYGLRNRFEPMKKLEEVKGLQIGTYFADVRHEYLLQRGFHADAAPADADNIDKLLQGRIDLWVSDRFTANGMLRQRKQTARIEPVLSFNYVDLYLACNPRMDKALIQKLQDAMQQLKKDGTWGVIEQRYVHWPDMSAPAK